MATVEDLFADLNRQINEEEFDDVLETCDKILAKAPNDDDAMCCRLVALMHLNKFQDAISFVKENNMSSKWFELAYCHYRNNDLEDAISILKANSDGSVGAIQLMAQALFRHGDYLEAAKIYEGLVGNEEVDEIELKTNMGACYSAAGAAPAADFLRRYEGRLRESADLCFNASCALVESGDLEGALKELAVAEELCESGLEDYDDEEIQDELAIYRVQRAYIQSCLGAREEALQLYEEVLKNKPSDAAVAAVAANNVVALKKDRDLFDSAKKSKAAVSQEVERKLTVRQRRAFAFNRCLLLLHMNKVDQCSEMLAQLQQQYTASELPCLVRASLLYREKKYDEGTKMLEEYVKKQPGASLQVQLTLAQLHLNQRHVKPAIKVLESVNAQKPRLGVVATLVRLYESCNDMEGALRVLEQAAASPQVEKTRQRILLQQSGMLYLSHKNYPKAVQVYEKLVEGLGKGEVDLVSVARLVQAAAVCDPAKAQRYAAMLPSESGSFDINELESIVASRPSSSAVADAATPQPQKQRMRGRHGPSEAKKKKRKLKRVMRHIPDYDPNHKGDPERWLPRHQRASARRGRKGKAIIKGGQGGVSATAMAQLQHTAAPAGSPAASVAPSASAVASGSAPAPAAARKKGRR